MVREAKSPEEEHPLYDVAVKAQTALKAFNDPVVVLMSPAHGFIGDREKGGVPDTLRDVACLALVPHPGRVQGPQGPMGLAMDCGGIVGSNPSGGIISRMEMGSMLPRYLVRHLPPEDIIMVLDLYAQALAQGERRAVPDEVWEHARSAGS